MANDTKRHECVEYACPVWHTNLPSYLADSIECVQKRALKCIHPGKSYDEVLNSLKIPTLKERRDTLCKQNFVKMCTEGHKLNDLIPPARDTCYSLRKHGKYPMPRAWTNRYYKSFVPWGLRFCQWGSRLINCHSCILTWVGLIIRCICFILCKFNFWLPTNVSLILSEYKG